MEAASDATPSEGRRAFTDEPDVPAPKHTEAYAPPTPSHRPTPAAGHTGAAKPAVSDCPAPMAKGAPRAGDGLEAVLRAGDAGAHRGRPGVDRRWRATRESRREASRAAGAGSGKPPSGFADSTASVKSTTGRVRCREGADAPRRWGAQ